MAPLQAPGPAVLDGELDDDEIQRLLERASARLQANSGSKEMIKSADHRTYSIPKLNPGKLDQPYISTKGEVALLDPSKAVDHRQQKKVAGIRQVEDPVTAKKSAEEKKKATAGAAWYNLPRTQMTPELKRDLQLLKMRNVLDPHRHYRKDNGKMKAPEYSQVGTIVEGPTEFFSGRIENKKRKKTFVEEVLAGEQETGRFKKKFGELQDRKGSGKKAFYEALKAKRKHGVKKGGSG